MDQMATEWFAQLEERLNTATLSTLDEIFNDLFNGCVRFDLDDDALQESINGCFASVMDTYFKLRKYPELHASLFKMSDQDFKFSLNTKLTSIYSSQIYNLPHGQSIKIWKLFLKNLSLESDFMLQLFHLFLIHQKIIENQIPAYLRPPFLDALSETNQYLQQLSKSSTEFNVNPILLNLILAFGDLKVLCLSYNDTIVPSIEIEKKAEWFDITSIHDYLDIKACETLFDSLFAMDSSDELIKIGIKLLTQKIRCLNIVKFKAISRNARRVAEVLIEYVASKIYLLDLADFCLLIPLLKPAKISLLNDSLVSFSTESIEGFSKCKSVLSLNFCRQSSEFQSLFMASLFKEAPKLTNHQQVIEMFSLISNDEFNWADKSISSNKPSIESLNFIKSTDCILKISKINKKATLDVEKVLHILELLNSGIILDYLMPLNQIRCLLGFSAILINFDLEDKQGLELIRKILATFFQIFTGKRSVWFFDYYNPFDYIIIFLTKINNYYQNLDKEIISSLLEAMLTKALRGSKFSEDLVKISELLENDILNQDLAIVFEMLFLTHLSSLINKLTNSALKNKINLDVTKYREIASKHFSQLFNRLRKAISKKRDETLISEQLIEAYCVILEFGLNEKNVSEVENVINKKKGQTLFMGILQIAFGELRSPNGHCRDHSVKFLSLICSYKKQLQQVLPEDFVFQIWDALFPELSEEGKILLIKEESEMNRDNNLNYEKGYDAKRCKNILRRIKKFSPDQRVLEDDNGIEKKILQLQWDVPLYLTTSLIDCCTKHEYEKLTKQLLLIFKHHTDNVNVCFNIIGLWKAIFVVYAKGDIEGDDQHEKLDITKNLILDELLFLISCVCRTHKKEESRVGEVLLKESSLELINLMLQKAKQHMSHQRLHLCLHSCILTSVHTYTKNTSLFIRLFNSVYSVLNQCMLLYRKTVVAAMATFNSLIINLLSALMEASDQYLISSCSVDVQTSLESCAQNLNGLLTLIASYKENYVIYAPHVVAVYINESQKVTLYPTVKKHILSGLYRIFNLIENNKHTKSFDYIHSRLPQPGREIFKVIHNNYEKYYKFKGYI